jgi:DMSO/TMAO reductase YedYZ heme-binding membrane subunit
MMLAELNPQAWWYVARAAGFVAWGLSVGAVLLGLALATRALGSNPRPAWLLDLHRFVGGLTVCFIALHVGGLVGDSYVHFGLIDVLVPLASPYQRLPVAAGVLAMWLLVAVEATSLMMKRLSRPTWHMIHLSSYAAAVLATLHGFTAGTDSGNGWYVGASVASLAAMGFFLVYGLLLPRRRPPRRAPLPPPPGA